MINTAPAIDPSVQLFRPNLSYDSIKAEDSIEIRPTTTLKKGQPISFDIVGSSDMFLDPTVLMKVWFKITKPDGTSIGSDTPVAPINNFVHSL